MRQVNSFAGDKSKRVQQPRFGGTGGGTLAEAIGRLNLVSTKSSAKGETLIPLDSNGVVHSNYIDSKEAQLFCVSGNPTVPKGTTVQFKVVGPAGFTIALSTADASAAGSATVTDNIISFTAPNAPKKVTLTINGQYTWTLDIVGAQPAKPTIVSPVQGAVSQASMITVTGSAYSQGSAGALKESVWQISENLDFVDAREVVFTGAVTGMIDQLLANRSYYLRVKYNDATNQGSLWSDIVGISTKSVFLPSTEVSQILPTAIILENGGTTSFSATRGFRVAEAAGGNEGRLIITTDEADIVNAQGFHEFDRGMYVFGKNLNSPVVLTSWNPNDKDVDITLSNGNLSVATGGNGGTVRSVASKSSGKWYWEMTKTAGVDFVIGVAKPNASLSGPLGGDANGFGYVAGTGQKYNSNGKTAYGAPYANGDVIGVALDIDAGTLTFYKNGVSQGVAFSGLSGTFHAAEGTTNPGDAGTANFGASLFAFTPPAGYSPNQNWVSQTKGTSSVKKFQTEASTDAGFGRYTAVSGNGRYVSASALKALVGRSFLIQYLDTTNVPDQVMTPESRLTQGGHFGPHVMNTDGSRLTFLTGDGLKLAVLKPSVNGFEVAQELALNPSHGSGHKTIVTSGDRELIFVISKSGIEVFKVMRGQAVYLVASKYQAHSTAATAVGAATVTQTGNMLAVALTTATTPRVDIVEYDVATNTITSKSIAMPTGETRFGEALALAADGAALFVGAPGTTEGGKVYRYSGTNVGSTLTTDLVMRHSNAGNNPTGEDEAAFGRSMKFSRRFTELFVASMTRVHVLR